MIYDSSLFLKKFSIYNLSFNTWNFININSKNYFDKNSIKKISFENCAISLVKQSFYDEKTPNFIQIENIYADVLIRNCSFSSNIIGILKKLY